MVALMIMVAVLFTLLAAIITTLYLVIKVFVDRFETLGQFVVTISENVIELKKSK